MALPTTYRYETYRNGTYLGVLPNVSSEFTYTLDVNSAGCQLIITTAQDVDTQNQAVVLMTDESGNQMTDESGLLMTTDRVSDIYGSNIFNSMIQSGNEIKVWEFTQWQPNGVLVFDGIISRWNPHIGSNDSVDLTIISYGYELDNNILYGSTTADQINTTVDTQDNALITYNNGTAHNAAQVFTTGMEITNVYGFMFQCPTFLIGGVASGGSFTAKLYTYTSGNPDSGTLLGTATGTATGTDDPATTPFVTVSFGSPITVSGESMYAVVLSSTNYVAFAQSGGTYGRGSAWQSVGASWTIQSENLVFVTLAQNSAGLFTNSIYFGSDPAGMVSSFMGNYISAGGRVGLGTITASSASVTYNFILNTVLEGVLACLKLAPSGYYWYVDPGSNLLNFLPQSTTPDLTLTFKVHINNFELLATSETSYNAAYLTAGNNAQGETILVYAQDPSSITRFGRRLTRISDSRISDGSTAQQVVSNFITTNSQENYQSTVTLLASNYDLTTLSPGKIVGFNGFNSYADTVTMMIVNIERHEDYAILTLGTVPKRSSTTADIISRSLLSSQTVNNPLTAN